MKRMWILITAVMCPLATCCLLVALCPRVALAQPGTPPYPGSRPSAPYQPAVPAPTTVNAYGGYPGSYGGGTVAGSALNGMASVISAKGDYNLSTSAAAINWTEAQRNEIQNRQQATNAYFEMRATNRAAVAAERGPRPTMEQLVKIAREGVPSPLTSSQADPVSGRLVWPSALQDSSFDTARSDVDELFAKRARQGGLGYSDQSAVRETIDAMFSTLKEQIRSIPPQDYVACRNFLQSLTFAAAKSDL